MEYIFPYKYDSKMTQMLEYKMSDLSLDDFDNRNNNKILPNSIRACIIGKSGCGKTNTLMNLLLENALDNKEYLDYNNLYIFSTTLEQPAYEVLKEGFEHNLTKKEIVKYIKDKEIHLTKEKMEQKIMVKYFDDPSKIPDPSEIDKNLKTLIVFDDILLEKQNKVESYYTRGRHNNVDCIYISQNYTKLPKNTIRENTNLFILFPQDIRTLDYFYRDHCTDIKKEKFINFCNDAWDLEHGFVTIDLTRKKNNGKYRKMLEYFYIQK